MPNQQLPFPQGAVSAAQNPQGAIPVAGIVPQQAQAPTPNPLQQLGGGQEGPQGVPQAGNLSQLQLLFEKIKDPKARLEMAAVLGQSVPAPSVEELQAQLQSMTGGG